MDWIKCYNLENRSKNVNFIESKFVKEICDITNNMYHQGWDERNGGNISYMIDEEQIRCFFKKDVFLKDIPLNFVAGELIRNKYFLVTGTGKYFKNISKDPESNLGLIKISNDGKYAKLLWGFKDGGNITSEFPTHLMTHEVRLKINPNNRVVIHSHPTYTICMGACLPIDDVVFTRKLWKANTEAVIVFPEGIGVLPSMVCGTKEIGEATAEKMKNHRIVSWTNHGIYGVGNNIDEAFGLIETVEKTAKIYMLTLGQAINEIPDQVIIELAKLWNLEIMPGVVKGK